MRSAAKVSAIMPEGADSWYRALPIGSSRQVDRCAGSGGRDRCELRRLENARLMAQMTYRPTLSSNGDAGSPSELNRFAPDGSSAQA